MNLLQTLPVNYWQPIVDNAFFEKLKLINWEPIFLRLMSDSEGEKMTFTEAIAAIWRYAFFLFLIQEYPNLKMVPNQEIDAVLHAHLADNLQFSQDCQNLFNRKLEHVSEFGLKQAERSEWLLTFTRTQALFESHFGSGAMGNSAVACCEILLN